MKSIIVAALALACVLGLATANYGYYPSTGGSGVGGQSGLLMLLLLFFLIFFLNNNNTSTGGVVTITNASATG